MPLIKTEKVNENRTFATWRIDESFDELLDQLQPVDSDKTLLLDFRSPKKQLEWLAGRLTLKHLTAILGIPYQGVKKDVHGKPSLRNCTFEISLTHSFPYVAAIIDTDLQPVGIDLEQPRDKIVRLAYKFLNDEEMAFANNHIFTLNIMWCVKETLFKIYGRTGLLFKDQMHIEPFNIDTSKIITGNIIVNDTIESHKLQCVIDENYILTYNL